MSDRLQHHVIALITAIVLLLGFAAPATAGPRGNSAAAHACQGEGYRTYDRGDGQPFDTVGQCVRSATRGELVPLAAPPPPGPDLHLFGGLRVGGMNGYITGSGFTPWSTITNLTAISLPSGTVHDLYQAGVTPSRVDETGAFVTTHTGYWFCVTGGTTAMRITAVTSDGITYTETFALACPAR